MNASTTPEPVTFADPDTIKAGLHPYIAALQADGFTVYAPGPDMFTRTVRRPSGYFHYSREVDGQTCYGIFHDGADGFEGPHHSMPLHPSHLNGSGARVGAKWGDPDTLGMDELATDSVEMARIVARPQNWCPYNAHPSPEATARASSGRSVPQKFYRGAMLRNAAPWGIPEGRYLPLPTLTPANA